MQAQHAREAIVVGSRGMHDARRFLLGSVPPSCLTRPAVSAPSGRELARLGAVVTDATTWQSTMRLASMRAVSDKPFGEALRILMSEHDLIPVASDRIDRAEREGEQQKPRQPSHLHAPVRDLRIAPDRLAQASGKVAELVLVAQKFRRCR